MRAFRVPITSNWLSGLYIRPLPFYTPLVFSFFFSRVTLFLTPSPLKAGNFIFLILVYYVYYANYLLNTGGSLVGVLYFNSFLISTPVFTTYYFYLATLLLILLYLNSRKLTFLVFFIYLENFHLLKNFWPPTPTFINKLLENTLNQVHPLLLFIVLISALLFVIACTVPCTLQPYLRFARLHILKVVRTQLTLNLLLLFTLLLGGFWANQLNTWGGWWVWDSSETLLLVWLLLISTYIHSKEASRYSSYLLALVVIMYIISLSSILLNKLWVQDSLHTFFSNSSSHLPVIHYYLLTYSLLALITYTSLYHLRLKSSPYFIKVSTVLPLILSLISLILLFTFTELSLALSSYKSLLVFLLVLSSHTFLLGFSARLLPYLHLLAFHILLFLTLELGDFDYFFRGHYLANTLGYLSVNFMHTSIGDTLVYLTDLSFLSENLYSEVVFNFYKLSLYSLNLQRVVNFYIPSLLSVSLLTEGYLC